MILREKVARALCETASADVKCAPVTCRKCRGKADAVINTVFDDLEEPSERERLAAVAADAWGWGPETVVDHVLAAARKEAGL